MRDPKKEKELLEQEDLFGIYYYIIHVIKGRWPEAEPILIENPYRAYQYAKEVIKDRWPEAEPYLKDSPCWTAYLDFLEEIGQDIDTWRTESW